MMSFAGVFGDWPEDPRQPPGDPDADPLVRPKNRSHVVLRPDEQAIEDAMLCLVRAASVLSTQGHRLTPRDARLARLLAAKLLQGVPDHAA